jgi:hypothetical protein
VVVRAEVGGELRETALERLGIKGFRPAGDVRVEVGLSLRPDHARDGAPLPPAELGLRVERGTSTAVYASVRAAGLAAGEYQLVRITERAGDRVLGGLGFVVISGGKRGAS